MTTPTPSPLSASRLITQTRQQEFKRDQEVADDIQFIQYMLRATGEKCGQCRHNLLVDHTEGKCDLCGCIRVRKHRSSKKGMNLSELYDLEAAS